MLAENQKTKPHVRSSKFDAADLYGQFMPDLERVEHEIIANAQSEVSKVSQVTEYVVRAGGKRVRPLLALVSAKLCGSITDSTIKLATAVEYIHTATLLHDDVLDESSTRRGKPTARNVWGNTNSVLVGDFLFARAFELMVKTNSLSILEILSKSASIIVSGEVRQLNAIAGNEEITRQDYLATIDAKTAELFRAACLTGAISGNASDQKAFEAMSAYGLNLGRSFQIIDDILDYTGQSEVLGKQVGDDFREQKITLPVIIGLERADKTTAETIINSIKNPEQTSDAFDQLKFILGELGAFDTAIEQATKYIEKSVLALDYFGENRLSSALKSYARVGLSRVS